MHTDTMTIPTARPADAAAPARSSTTDVYAEVALEAVPALVLMGIVGLFAAIVAFV